MAHADTTRRRRLRFTLQGLFIATLMAAILAWAVTLRPYSYPETEFLSLHGAATAPAGAQLRSMYINQDGTSVVSYPIERRRLNRQILWPALALALLFATSVVWSPWTRARHRPASPAAAR